MTGSTILVVPDTVESVAACLRIAADASVALNSPRIEVLHVRIDPAGTIEPSEEVLTGRYQREIELRSANEGAALRAAFDAWRAGAKSVSASWTEIEAVPAEAIRERGSRAALLVLAQQSEATHPAAADGFDAALFDTGKPVLVVPAGAAGRFGRHLAVGWRDVPATRRSLTALRPWLMAAGTVSVIAVADGDAALPDDDWRAANLPPRTTVHVVRPAGRSDGETLLREAARLGADGLAIGAYRRGRLVERVMGGVTRDVLRMAGIPVLMQV